jgi:membrane protein
MRLRQVKLFTLLKETGLKWNADNCVRLGAALSYYTVFSIFPLILVILTIIRLLLDNSDAARDAILDALSSVTGGFREDFLQTLEAASQTRRSTSIIGTATLLLGASWVFGELVSAFNIIWGLQAPARQNFLQFVRTTFFSFALVLSGAFLLLVSMVLSAILTVLSKFMEALPGGVIGWSLAQTMINLCVLTAVFALLFRFLPQTEVAWRDVWLGAALTAVFWTILQFAIAYYIALSSYRNYGAVGSILALVAWVYLSSQVLFLGGEFTAVYALHYGSRSQQPPALPLTPTAAPLVSQRPEPTPAAMMVRAQVVSAVTGATVGVLSVLLFTVVAVVIGLGRAIRRLLFH